MREREERERTEREREGERERAARITEGVALALLHAVVYNLRISALPDPHGAAVVRALPEVPEEAGRDRASARAL